MMTKHNDFMTKPVCRKDLLIDSIVASAVACSAILGIGIGAYIADRKKKKKEEKEQQEIKPKRHYTIIKKL